MLEFKLIEKYSEKIGESIVIWYNDPEISPYLHPNFTGKELEVIKLEDIKTGLSNNINKRIYGIYDDELLIGEVSITLNFEHLAKKDISSAWIGLCIGDKNYWGKGVAKKAMIFLEKESKRLGFKRIELGVFGNNKKAQSLYEKMGYELFMKIDNFTYYDGSWYADLRMEKYL